MPTLNRFALLALSLSICFLSSSTVRAEEDELVENPAYKSWASHKVGSAVTYESNSVFGAQTIKSEMTQKLSEITPEKAVIEITMKLDIPGVPPQPPQTQEIPAKVKKSQATPGKLPEGMKGEVKDKGTEKIEIGGKSYECHVWEFSGEQNGVKSTGTTWTSEKIPGTLAQMKSAANVAGQDMKTSLTITKIDTK